MKIHIVQKGDTLWQLAQQYGVDFEQLKQMNTHLDNPDQISPGMKVKIPTSPAKAKPTETPKKLQPKKVEPKKVEPKKVEPKKVEPKKVEPKKPAPKIDLDTLKDLIKRVPSTQLKQIIYEIKPEFVQEIEIDIELHQHQHHHPKKPITPPPAPSAAPKKMKAPHCPPFSPFANQTMMPQQQQHQQQQQHHGPYVLPQHHQGYGLPQQNMMSHGMSQQGYGMPPQSLMSYGMPQQGYGMQPGMPPHGAQTPANHCAQQPSPNQPGKLGPNAKDAKNQRSSD